MKSSRNSARQLFGLTLTLVGLLSWNILPIPHPELAVRAANRVRGAEPTGQTVSRVVINGRVAFVSSETTGGQSDIYTMNPDGSDRKQLTFSQEHERQPAWSPDGTKIAFARYTVNGSGDSEISVMNADGSDQRRLTQSNFDQSPTWSPDGTKIAFWRIDSIFMVSSSGPFVMNADGTDQRAVASILWGPGRSPDGLKFAFADNGTLGTYGIYLINVDGSNRTQITQPPASSPHFEDHGPAWSPDGSKITFARCVDSNGWGCYTTSHLWGVNADGSNPTKLTDTLAYTHAWSPDGTKIIFGSVDDNLEPRDLFVMNPDGSGLTNITNTDGKHEQSPSWQALPLTLPNPIDDPQFFVRQQYRDFLNREPDTPGLTFWTGEITECSNPEKRQPGESFIACTERKRANTSAAFFLSPEFQNTGSFVLRVYWGTLGKLPNSQCPGVPSGLPGHCRPLYTEYVAEVSQVATGIVVNDQLDPNVINANKRAFIEQFVTKPAFRAIYDSLNSQQFVDKLFETTGINASATDRAALVDGLNGINGQPATETRSSVVFKVVDGTTTQAGGALVFNTSYGQAFYDKEFDDAFVFMEYIGYLRRNPDQGGYEHWLGKLKLYGNWMDAQMVLAFISSPEYRARFGQP